MSGLTLSKKIFSRIFIEEENGWFNESTETIPSVTGTTTGTVRNMPSATTNVEQRNLM